MVLAALVFSTPLALAGSNYENGKAAYRRGSYEQAIGYFARAVKSDPHNTNALFYMGLAYAKNGNLQEARKAFELVIQSRPPGDPLAAKARNNIDVMSRAQISLASGEKKAKAIFRTSRSQSRENYLTHAIPNGRIVRFDETKMPLKVYIESGAGVPGYQSWMDNLVWEALKTWRSATLGRVRFRTTNVKENADIVVHWQESFKDGILGVSPYRMMGDTLLQSDVNLATHMPDSNIPMPKSVMRSTVIHEFGHAIGIRGHSPYPADVMYFSMNDINTRRGSLSDRDVNTIRLLYKFEADVKNDGSVSLVTARQQQESLQEYYRLVELGVKAEENNDISQAIDYYRQAIRKNDTEGVAKLALSAVLYNEGVKMTRMNNYQGAKANFQESEQLAAAATRDSKVRKESADLLNQVRKVLQVMRANGL